MRVLAQKFIAAGEKKSQPQVRQVSKSQTYPKAWLIFLSNSVAGGTEDGSLLNWSGSLRSSPSVGSVFIESNRIESNQMKSKNGSFICLFDICRSHNSMERRESAATATSPSESERQTEDVAGELMTNSGGNRKMSSSTTPTTTTSTECCTTYQWPSRPSGRVEEEEDGR